MPPTPTPPPATPPVRIDPPVPIPPARSNPRYQPLDTNQQAYVRKTTLLAAAVTAVAVSPGRGRPGAAPPQPRESAPQREPLPRPPSSAGFQDLPVACINGVRVQIITHGAPSVLINHRGPAVRYEYGCVEVDHHCVRIVPINPALANPQPQPKPYGPPSSHVDARLPPISGFRRASLTGPASAPNLPSASSASQQQVYSHIEIPFASIEEEDHAWADDGEVQQDRVSFWVKMPNQLPLEYVFSFNPYIASEVEVPLLEGLLKHRKKQLDACDEDEGIPYQLRAAQREFHAKLVQATEAALEEAQCRRSQARIKRARSRRFSAPS